jgi:SpoVK/Ycf46/Vps4 family AAA+-type ATPase
MGRRTNVSSANDRYANLETNYLLQRLESFQGIVIITTNAAQNIDDAFARRMDVVIDFARPDATLRRRLWDIHLPTAHDISADTLEQVVDRCALSGGQICTASLYAALLALHDETSAGDAHLLQAVEREYRKQGESYPLRRISSKRNQLQRLRNFS